MKKMTHITKEIIDSLIQESTTSDRKRSHILLHHSIEDKIQSLLFGLQPTTRIRVHRHLNDTETINCIRGRMAVLFYKNNGDISDYKILDSNNMILKFEPRIWHSYICLEENTIGWEIKEGPYRMDDIEFADWCPKETDGLFDCFLEEINRFIGTN